MGMTTVLGINGSPRKGWNTATLLERALEGAASAGAHTELVHLYDLDFSGCTSCFACKLKGGRSYGRCAVQDELTPVLDRIRDADVLVLGSPIYFGTVTGEMRCFMERLLFPYLVYAHPPTSLFDRTMRTAFIYTMNVSEEQMRTYYGWHIEANEGVLQRTFGQSESLFSTETLQFDDYEKVVFSYLDPEERRERRRTVFPEDSAKAFALGARLAGDAASTPKKGGTV
jgi:multimeric flavodoxin WrbA